MTTDTQKALSSRYRWQFWTHLVAGIILVVSAPVFSNQVEDRVGSILLGLPPLTIAAMLYKQRAVGLQHFYELEPDAPDSTTVDWHQALDKSGSLLTLWSLFIAAFLVGEMVSPDSFTIPASVSGPLTGILTVGGLFFVLNDFRPTLHTATRDRHRSDPRLWPGFVLIGLVGLFMVSAAWPIA